MQRFLMTLYAGASYAVFLAAMAWLVGFVGDFPLARTMDVGPPTPLAQAVAVDLLLIALFGLQHSVMARPAFKRAWTRLVPEPMERSTYVLVASLLLALVLWQWRPIAAPVVWEIRQPAGIVSMTVLLWIGWGVLLLSTWLIDHYELFGLRQAWAHLRGRTPEPQAFVTPVLYRHVRHPIYLGFLIAFWATPRMTLGHLLFAAGFSVYILVGIRCEERDLVDRFGDRYRRYRDEAGMLWPALRRRRP